MEERGTFVSQNDPMMLSLQLLPTLPEPRDSSLTEENANLVFQLCRLYFAAVDQGNFDALIDAYDKKCIFTHVSEPSQRCFLSNFLSFWWQKMVAKNGAIVAKKITQGRALRLALK